MGYSHILMVDMNFKVSSFGCNKYGQCGHKDVISVNKPTIIESLKDINIIQVACGQNHSVFLTDEFIVYACGDNQFGQLGVGNRFRPSYLMFPARMDYFGGPIKRIRCGDDFTVLLNIYGQVFSCGSSKFGQLGNLTY